MVKTPHEKFQLKKMSFDPTPVLLKMTPISADPPKKWNFQICQTWTCCISKDAEFYAEQKTQ